MELIPAVDVLGGAVVRLRQGVFNSAVAYADDPVEMAARWHRGGAALVHVVDLGAARTGEQSVDLWRGLGDAGVPFQAAGGIRDLASARAALEAGASRIVVGTTGVWSPEALAEMTAEFGSDAVVGAVDVSEGRARGRGWEDAGRPVDAVLDDLVEAGAGRLMVTSIARDGTLLGPDLDLIGRSASRVPVPIIASGGIGELDDLRSLAGLPVEGVVVGRALYEGRFSLEDGLAAAAAS